MKRFILPFLSVVVAAALPSRAQPLADRVPQDAILYVGWAGADSPGPGYAGSHLKAVLDASNVRELIDESLPRLFDQVVKRNGGDKDAAEAMALFRAIGGAMWRHPSALYFGGLDLTNPDVPFPKLAFLCDAGKDAKTLADELNRLLAKLPDNPIPTRVEEQDGLVTLAFGRADVSAKKKPAIALTQRKEFKATMAQVGKDPSAVLYLDVEGQIEQVEQLMANFAPDQARLKWPTIRDAIGLASLKRVAWTGGFDGKDWATQALIESPEPRTGFVKALVDAPPLTDALLKTIPRSATLAVAGHFDANGLLTAVREMVTKIEPQAAQGFDELMEQVWNTVGLDLRADILDTFGNEWAVYADPTVAGEGLLGLTLVNRLKKPEGAEKALAKLEQLLNGALQAQAQRDHLTLAFRTAKQGDLTIHYMSVPGVAPAWAVKDGNLYVGLYPQVVNGAADHVASKAASILDNEDFVAIRKRLGGDAASAVSFSDLPKTAAAGYGEALMLSRALLGAADLFGAKTPAMTLPTLAKLRPHVTPAGGVAWVDKTGWHMRSVSPFPGSGVLNSGGAVTVLGGVVPLIGYRQARVQAQWQFEQRAVEAAEAARAAEAAKPGKPTAPPQPKKEGQ